MERNSLISERYLLRGAPNARDLGGLPTVDGRKVRAGVLLRSGELAGITDADAHTLSQYPLRTVIDFRTDLEREQKPDRVLAGVRYIHCPIVQQTATGLTREEHADPYAAVVAHAKTMAGEERAFMCAMYRSLVTHDYSIAHYRQFFAHLLAQTDGALLYHCSAGKDRVGVGTMLLLTALGVDWPVIVENYLITNERMAATTDCLLTAVKDYDLTEAERDVIRTFDSADAEFLTAARDAAAQRCGSMDAFLSQALGVGAAERAARRARWRPQPKTHPHKPRRAARWGRHAVYDIVRIRSLEFDLQGRSSRGLPLRGHRALSVRETASTPAAPY